MNSYHVASRDPPILRSRWTTIHPNPNAISVNVQEMQGGLTAKGELSILAYSRTYGSPENSFGFERYLGLRATRSMKIKRCRAACSPIGGSLTSAQDG